MIFSRIATLAPALLGGGARVALGALWVHEGALKLHAGFGASDIALVARGATVNSRVPDFFAPVAAAMDATSGLLGFAVPIVELLIGVLLVLGLAPRTAAFLSAGLLSMYWTTDQLIDEYPVMAILSAVVLAMRGSSAITLVTASRWIRLRRSQNPQSPLTPAGGRSSPSAESSRAASVP